jgi:hypothetical protein
MKRWNINISKETIEEMQRAGYTQLEMASKLGVSVSVVERRIKKFNLQGYSPVRYNLMTPNNPVFCYLLGWFAADGYLTKHNRVSLRTYEHDVVDKLSSYFGTRKYEIRREGKCSTHELYFAQAPAIFKEICGQGKTRDCQVPAVQYFDMFLRGVIEGDGTIRPLQHKGGGLVRIFTCSENFALELQARCPYPLRLRKDRMGWELSSNSTQFLSYVYTNHLDFVCSRKFKRVQPRIQVNDIVQPNGK